MTKSGHSNGHRRHQSLSVLERRQSSHIFMQFGYNKTSNSLFPPVRITVDHGHLISCWSQLEAKPGFSGSISRWSWRPSPSWVGRVGRKLGDFLPQRFRGQGRPRPRLPLAFGAVTDRARPTSLVPALCELILKEKARTRAMEGP